MDLDTQLLERYVRTRDAEAFTQLVRRHAGMVFGVARRVTGNHHDAEEVTQGCFLELARQAERVRGSLAGWLYAAANGRARDLNRAAVRRRRHEQAASRAEPSEPYADAGWAEIAPLIDAALAELPEEMRLAVVMYYLEGRKQEEVAEELGVTQATVSRRLEMAVAMLREKLEKLEVTGAGVAPGLAGLPGLLGQHAVEVLPKTLGTALGKLAVAGVGPGTGAAGSGGTAVVPAISSAAGKGATALAAKIAAAVVVTAAVSTAGIALLPKQQPAIAMTVPAADENLNDVLTRLRAESMEGLGDGVGFRLKLEVDGKPDQAINHSQLDFYARHGDGEVGSLYGFAKAFVKEPTGTFAIMPTSLDKPPDGWPAPTVDQVLRFVDATPSPFAWATDGQSWWSADQEFKAIKFLPSAPQFKKLFGKPGLMIVVWPSASYLNAALDKHPSQSWIGKFDLVRQATNPAVLGVHLFYGRKVHDQIKSGWEHTWWLDPARNDVPVNEEYQDYGAEGEKNPARSWKREYLGYAQLNDGRWYPTRWRESWGEGQRFDYWLVFDPGRILDARWFGDPTNHFVAGVPKVVDGSTSESSMPKGIAAIPHVVATATSAAVKSFWRWWMWALAALAFGAAGVLAILHRRGRGAEAPLHGWRGPRRR